MSRDKEWFELPRPAAMTRLVELRNELRAKNLHDTEDPPHPQNPGAVPSDAKGGRTASGEFNDLRCPMMGSTGARFGRNVPLSETFPDTANLMNPNPRTISQELFTRTAFQPATILNVMAAAWIQFQTHDWFLHRQGTVDSAHDIPLTDADPWPQRPMRVPKTPVDPQKRPDPKRPPAYVNDNSHWWDGSQIYGSTPAVQATLRTGDKGKVKVGDDCRLGLDPVTGLEVTGMTENAWVALSLLHGLFAKEHNAVCDRLATAFPTWNDQQLFIKARLVVSALMAKIHTVEWTPAILPNAVTVLALRTNWQGLAPGLQKVFPALQDNELLSGIPGSPTDHHSAPYSLTEEFSAVYRMHSLLPDDFTLWSVETGKELERFELPGLSGRAGRKVLERCQVADLLYSFGISHPGALRLHNFPRHLQQLRKDSGELFDIAAVDILRDRERGVPRYNQFRRLFHKKPVTSFEELTDNPQWAQEIKRVYDGDLEKVDLLTGLMAEPLPEGFGFSDTAFRVFILMASRRLKSDRFLSQDYTADTYTQPGIEWVEETSMLDVLHRHVPALKPALAGVENAFKPWRRVG
jgi:hypothetical protein